MKYCIICKEARLFSSGPNGRANATCQNCESLERHRALFIMNEVIAGHLQKNNVLGKVIEVAPSKVSKSVFAYFADRYQSFDSDPAADGRECDFVADICSIPLADNSVSLFVALHVLEHVTQDQLAMKEISRVLAPGGLCILQVPLAEYPAVTQEELILEDEIRIEKYGQIDHVRLYGEDILERLHENELNAVFFDIDEVVPNFLVDILGLNDGMRFILAESNNGRASGENLTSLLNEFRRDFSKLEIFCRIFETKSEFYKVV
jgi:SAM-dependent methyltransferase